MNIDAYSIIAIIIMAVGMIWAFYEENIRKKGFVCLSLSQNSSVAAEDFFVSFIYLSYTVSRPF